MKVCSSVDAMHCYSLSGPLGEVKELHQATERTPGIVVVTPEEDDEHGSDIIPTVCRRGEPGIKMNALPRHLVQTSRPPLSLSS